MSLSFAVEGVGGQEQAPSAFLEEVRRLTGLVWEARALPAITPLDEVLTHAELRQRVVLESQPPSLTRLRVSAPDPARHLLRHRFEGAPWLASAKEMVQVEIERLHFFGDTRKPAGRHTGAVDDPALAEAIRDTFRFDTEKPLSASALARFGNCGFQGFVSYGLKVPEPEQPGEDFDRRGQGVFWHRVLEEFFKKLKERGLLGRDHASLPEGLLDTVLDEVRTEFEARHYVGHPALWRLARERAKNMVRRILLDDRRGLPFEKLEPSDFELRFGPKNPAEGWNEVTLQVGEDTIHFEGTIDRLDTGGSGVGVIDYKSGKLSRSELAKKLLDSDFQLPLYLHAARVSGHRDTHQAAWFSLRTGKVIHLSEVLAKEEIDLDELLATEPDVRARLATEEKPNLANAVEHLVRTVRAGQFAMRPKDCGNCSYQSVCRITERRLVEDEGSHERGARPGEEPRPHGGRRRGQDVQPGDDDAAPARRSPRGSPRRAPLAPVHGDLHRQGRRRDALARPGASGHARASRVHRPARAPVAHLARAAGPAFSLARRVAGPARGAGLGLGGHLPLDVRTDLAPRAPGLERGAVLRDARRDGVARARARRVRARGARGARGQ